MFLICVISLFWIFIIGKEILAPLVISFFIAIFLLPVVTFFEKKLKLSRASAAAISIIILALLLCMIALLLGEQIAGFIKQWPSFRQSYSAAFYNLEKWLNATIHIDAMHQSAILKSETSRLASSSPLIISKTVLSVSSILLYLFFILIDTFFILFYRKLLIKFLAAFSKEQHLPVINLSLIHI